MVDYLRQLDSLGRIFPPEGEIRFADEIAKMMANLGEQGPPGVFAIVHTIKIETPSGKKVEGTTVLIWDSNVGGPVDADTQFTYDGQDNPVVFWDEDEEGWDGEDGNFPDIVPGSDVRECDWMVGDSGDCNECGLVLTWDDCQMSERRPGSAWLCEGCIDLIDEGAAIDRRLYLERPPMNRVDPSLPNYKKGDIPNGCDCDSS